LGSVGTILQFLKTHHVDTLVLAGALRRPTLSELKLDATGVTWIARLGKRSFQGDDSLLRGILALLEEEGFTVLGLSEVMESLLAPEGVLTASAPSPEEQEDIATGFSVLRHLGAADVGQALIVQQGLILGVEAIEGTLALVQRCASLAREGRAPLLVKGAKPQQDMRVDVPTVGIETIDAVQAAGFRGIALEAGKTCLLDREAVVQKADACGIFVVGMPVAPA
jgi:DUF1009 family protein